MKVTRKRYSAEFKAKVAMEGSVANSAAVAKVGSLDW
jgi:transposase-like protein